MLGWGWNRGRGRGGGQSRDEHWEKRLIKAGTMYIDDNQKRRVRSSTLFKLFLFNRGSICILKCKRETFPYTKIFFETNPSTLPACISSVFLHFAATVRVQGVNHFKGVTGLVWKIASDHSEPFLNLWLTINNKQNPRPPTSINAGITRWETVG